MKTTKKAFQKVVKAIRDDRNARLQINGEFPKAMMTNSQMEKHQATVNCGGQWSSPETSKERANEVMNDTRFAEFLETFNARAELEYNRTDDAYQVRLYF